MKQLLAHYWPELVITFIVWALIGWKMGLAAFFITVVLSMLEITLSADNAVINSRVLVKMSPLWQRLFMTVGILIAVFAVRFALPIVLVAIAAGLDTGSVLQLALNDPDAYGHKLHDIAHIIDGFGGIFLFMVALFFFVDRRKTTHWLPILERPLTHIGKIRISKIIVVGLLFVTLELLLPSSERLVVGVAMATGIIIYSLLHGITFLMSKVQEKNELQKQVGWAAFASFLYLEVLDASFSLDGVVGAFALTNNIIIIMAGLGIGALWVRTMTIYLVRHQTLVKYQYLESGAHWAIFALSMVMMLKLFGIELPELVVGTIGLVFIAGAVVSSIRANRKALILTAKEKNNYNKPNG